MKTQPNNTTDNNLRHDEDNKDLWDLIVTTHDEGDKDSWDLIIAPHSKFFDLRLKELWRYRDLVVLFIRRDFVAQFKQTILGPAWFILQPLMATLMYAIVFGNIAKLPSDGLPKILFYMSGTILWQYFASCLTSTSETFSRNAHIFGKVYFPRLAVPVSVICSQLLKLCLQLCFFFIFWIFYAANGATIHITMAILMLPLLIVIMAALSLGCGLLISAMTTKYRDLRFALPFLIQLWMYATPIVYPASLVVRPSLKVVLWLNPMTAVVEFGRYGFTGCGTVDLYGLGVSWVVTLLVLISGLFLFNKVQRTFVDTI